MIKKLNNFFNIEIEYNFLLKDISKKQYDILPVFRINIMKL